MHVRLGFGKIPSVLHICRTNGWKWNSNKLRRNKSCSFAKSGQTTTFSWVSTALNGQSLPQKASKLLRISINTSTEFQQYYCVQGQRWAFRCEKEIPRCSWWNRNDQCLFIEPENVLNQRSCEPEDCLRRCEPFQDCQGVNVVPLTAPMFFWFRL